MDSVIHPLNNWGPGEKEICVRQTCLPPVCPRFDLWTGCHVWVDFIGSVFCSMKFLDTLVKSKHLI